MTSRRCARSRRRARSSFRATAREKSAKRRVVLCIAVGRAAAADAIVRKFATMTIVRKFAAMTIGLIFLPPSCKEARMGSTLLGNFIGGARIEKVSTPRTPRFGSSPIPIPYREAMIRRESSFTIRRRDLVAALLGGSLVVAGAISQRLSLDPEPMAGAIARFARVEAAWRSAVDSPVSKSIPVSTTYLPVSTTLSASTTRRAARPRRLPPVPPRLADRGVADRGLALPAVPDKPLLLPPLTAPRIPNPIEQSDAEGVGSNPRVERLPQLVRTQQGIEVLPNPGIEPEPEGADSKGADSKGASGQTDSSVDPEKATPSSGAAATGTGAAAVKPLTDPPAGATKPANPAGSAATPGGVKVEPTSPSDQEKRQAAGGTGVEPKGLMTEERVQPMRDVPDPMTPLPGYGEPFTPIPSGPVVDLPLIRRDGDGDGGTCDDAPPLQIWRGGYLRDPLRKFPVRLPNP